MIELNTWAEYIADVMNLSEQDYKTKLIDFLEDNDWFGIEPEWKDGNLYIKKDIAERILPNIEKYFLNYQLSDKEKENILRLQYEKVFPVSAQRLKRFIMEFDIPMEITYQLYDFLLIYQKQDFNLMTDTDVSALMKHSYKELTKQIGDILAFFLSWLKDLYKTNYINDYVMSARMDKSSTNKAYDRDEYLELIYYLFNEEYILENEMYEKAANSKNHADTWLFLCLHFVCSLRNTDLVRIYHPRLTMPPEEVIHNVLNGSFSDKDARLTLYSITWRLNVLPMQPSKTSSHSGISSVKFCVPESLEVHMGTLFALCEAHRLLDGIKDDVPLIRCISDYDRITRYMGDDIGSIFLEANFRSRAVNKSYLQSIDMFADDVLGTTEGVKGYILAALARSHKGAYGEFAHTTAIYLKDANFSGLTPEFVAMELFERGVLSFIPSMLLRMITGNEYATLPVSKQTELLQILDMTPNEVESLVKLSETSRINARNTIVKVLGDNTQKKDILLNILHNIASGQAVSKQNECLCLITALNRMCPYKDRGQCIGCEYEISTKATVFLLVSEYNRMMNLYDKSSDELSKMKYKNLLKQQVLPSLDEILECVGEQYGDNVREMLEEIIKENTL